jgi:hypothetical protein
MPILIEARHFGRMHGTEAHKIALMCVDAVESKYQLLNKLFLHCLWQGSSSFGEV